jgi:hypothetical protein
LLILRIFLSVLDGAVKRFLFGFNLFNESSPSIFVQLITLGLQLLLHTFEFVILGFQLILLRLELLAQGFKVALTLIAAEYGFGNVDGPDLRTGSGGDGS